MGRNAKLKKARREARDQSRVDFLVHPGNLRHLRNAIRDSGARADSCIFSTRLLKRVCAEWDIPFRPLSVRARILNPIFGNYMREHRIFDLMEIPPEKVHELGEAGGRFIDVGACDGEPAPDKWVGHLVGVVGYGQRKFVVDLSIDQAHRPEKNILINTPTAFEATPGFLRGQDTIVGSSPHGLLFIYGAVPEDRSYEDAPAWQNEPDMDLGLTKREVERLARDLDQ